MVTWLLALHGTAADGTACCMSQAQEMAAAGSSQQQQPPQLGAWPGLEGGWAWHFP